MIDIHSVSGAISHKTIHTLSKTASVSTEKNDIKLPNSAKSDDTTFSVLARQLGESAVRAETRDASLNQEALAKLGTSVIDTLIGCSYYDNKVRHDSEIPDTKNPVLLERAKQATLFTNGRGNNPFTGLTQDQLRLIIYDESGTYTMNERKAAFSENHELQEAWNRAIAKRYVDEYNETGKSTETLVMILAHYNELPPIEKAQYPANYAANLTADDSSAMAIFSRLETRLSGFRA